METQDYIQLIRPEPDENRAGSAVLEIERPLALIAEDERSIARLIKLSLEHLGFEVQVASDGLEALKLLSQNPPQLAVLDIMMPYVDGLEVLRAVREMHGDDVRVIMLTAKAEDMDVFQGYRQGADAYLTKPFNPRELSLFVRRVFMA